MALEREQTREDRLRVLGEVRAGGAPALIRVLLRARLGDEAAAEARPAELLDALPETNWLDDQAILRGARIGVDDRLCDLTPAQRATLVDTLFRLPVHRP
ncbi:hypothetical protein [Streptacidiphilus monticola]|jgi:hypothetical protein|uniref:Uncharacterized protein n=1 Tax=Streptacidiphilus monticola TaxID=2161674 RepID=A0ABW1G962_9ACTN